MAERTTSPEARTAELGELRITLSPAAVALHARVREFLDDPRSRAGNTYFNIASHEREAAAELVDRGIAFYSGDYDSLGLMRHTTVG